MFGKSLIFVLFLAIFAKGSPIASLTDIEIKYSIWVGTDVSEDYSIRLTVPEGSSFFEVMNIAAAIDERFAFEYQTFVVPPYDEESRFITSIGGHAQRPEESTWWMIYEMPEGYSGVPGDELLSEWGVDRLIVKPKHQYLFWLRFVDLYPTK